ncbi:MAG: Prefoldin [Benniella sp.]|nr:MAG: Prefoldin [Benniella sp.]
MSSSSGSSSRAAAASSARPSDQELTQTYNTMKSELNQLAQKIGELETEADEHTLVIDTLTPLDPDRKCFRLVGGVLVERTVKEVLPALKTNQEGIKTVTLQLVQKYKAKEDEFNAFQKKYNIQVRQ